MSPRSASIDVDRFIRLTGLTVDQTADLLRSSRVRHTLHVLSQCAASLSLDRLATAVADLSDGLSRSTARTSLVHVILPKLEDYGVLDYQLSGAHVRLAGPVVDLAVPLGASAASDGCPASIGPDERPG